MLKKSAVLLLGMAVALCSACSSLPQRKEYQPRPILPSMERMSRGDQPGVWMSDHDAANLALWIEHVENVCR